MTEPAQGMNGMAAHADNGGTGGDAHDGNGDHAQRPYGVPAADPYPWGNLASFRSAAEGLTDAIKARCSVENRVKRGGGAVDVVQAQEMVKAARELEDRYREILMAAYHNQVPEAVRDWAAGIPGLSTGELFPRILGMIGHPRVAIPWVWEEGAPEPVPAGPAYIRDRHQQLWQYCGAGDPRTRPSALGHRPGRDELLKAGKLKSVRPLLFAFSSFLVRMHVRSETVAESAYYQLFEEARADAAGHDGKCVPGSWPAKCAGSHRRHEWVCKNSKKPPMAPNGCATVLHPEWGEPGSPWRPGHLNMHAHRVVHKEFLHDLWRISAL